MKKTIILIAPLLFLFATACNSQSKKAKTTEELLEMASKAPGINVGSQNYTISIPDGWTQRDTILNNLKFHFLYPPPEDAQFGTNINIINESMAGMTLKSYMQTNIKNMNAYMSSFKIIEQGNFSGSDITASWMQYVMQQNNMNLEAMLYIIPHNGIAYLMTAVVLEGNMDKYKSTFDKIAKSIKFKD